MQAGAEYLLFICYITLIKIYIEAETIEVYQRYRHHLQQLFWQGQKRGRVKKEKEKPIQIDTDPAARLNKVVGQISPIFP